MHTEVGPAERAAQTAQRKAIYEEIHPDARRGGDRKSDQTLNVGVCSFAAATAELTGKSVQTVFRDASRGEAIGDDLGAVAANGFATRERESSGTKHSS